MRYGLYIDGNATAARRWLPRVVELGFDQVALCAEDPKRGYVWSPEATRRNLDAARALGLDARIMDWPRPDIPDDARAFASRANAWRAVELDLEATYRGALAPRWLDEVIDLVEDEVVLDCTTFAGRFRHPTTGPAIRRILERGGRLHVQAESCTHPPGHPDGVPYRDPVLGPGRCQERAWRLAVAVCEEVGVDPVERLTLILASFDQRWPGVSAAQSMGDAYRAAVDLGCRTVEWWSAKSGMGQRTSAILRSLIAGG